MSSPNPDDPKDAAVGEQWKKNVKKAMETAKAWTRIHAAAL